MNLEIASDGLSSTFTTDFGTILTPLMAKDSCLAKDENYCSNGLAVGILREPGVQSLGTLESVFGAFPQ